MARSRRPARNRSGRIALPRFRLEYEKTLNDVLKSLGMEIPFQGEFADFSKINRELGRDLYIDEVKHTTFVEVDEEGTEAAGATSVGVGIVSMPPQVVGDRPFLFVSGAVNRDDSFHRPVGADRRDAVRSWVGPRALSWRRGASRERFSEASSGSYMPADQDIQRCFKTGCSPKRCPDEVRT